MPSVGMRRTTRVFGLVKGVDGARVLRSGRRILPDSGESKLRRTDDADDRKRDCLLKDHNKGKGHKPASGVVGGGGGGRHSTRRHYISTRKTKEELFHGKEDKEEDFRVKKWREVKIQCAEDNRVADSIFGIMYTRKRKRLDDQKSKNLGNLRNSTQRRTSKHVSAGRPILTVLVDSSFSGTSWFWSVFALVLRYTRKEKLNLSALAAFFLSQPINGVYTDHGVRFLQESPVNARGICKFFGAKKSMTLFSLDFAVAPLCFMHMHHTLLLSTIRRSCVFVKKSVALLANGESQPMKESDSEDEILVSDASKLRNNSVLQLIPSVRSSKLSGRSAQCRNGLNSGSFQKRRSSLRRRRARSISHGVHKSHIGALVSDLMGSKKNRTPFSPMVTTRKLRSSTSTNSTSILNVASSPEKDMDSLSCSANLLAIDSIRCCREEGFSVVLQFSSSQEWLLVIKRDKSIRYTHKAQKVMKPFSCNRFTHAIIWSGDKNWKLEFCNRQDWFIFKDLYKECSNRNSLAPNVKAIPIPGVQEVLGFDYPYFSLPVSYIAVHDDEVTRAMARNSGIYDMDSEDEEWLRKLNGEFCVESEIYEQLSEDNFELMIDGFEKGYFCSPEDYIIEKAASSLSHLGNRKIVEAAYGYWVGKRKQKKAPLLRVFQGHQVKKIAVISKPVFRKRRSFKRQASQLFGRGNQSNLLQEKEVEEDALYEHKAMLRVKEAQASAESSIELAMSKRQRAQLLMENADLAIYKALMALQITEIVRAAKSRDSAATLFLD